MYFNQSYQTIPDASPSVNERKRAKSHKTFRYAVLFALTFTFFSFFLFYRNTISAAPFALDTVTSPENSIDPIAYRHRHGLVQTNEYSQYVVSPLPDPNQDFPKSWSWTNVDGVDITTPNSNQHQPNNYCGACWAFAASHVIDDRMNTMRRNVSRFVGTTWLTSVQAILSCGPNYENGCNGGTANAAFEWIFKNGVSDQTCHNYEAVSGKCNELAMCQDCEPGGQFQETSKQMKGVCLPRPWGTFPIATISEYGVINPQGQLSSQWFRDDMVKRMKAEIYERGPIACAIVADPIETYFPHFPPTLDGKRFKPFIWTLERANYTCQESQWDFCCNHVIEVVGWGFDEEENMEYWLVRNSWGNYWGEHGWFRAKTGDNVIGLESACGWAVPHVLNDQEDILAFVHEGNKELREMAAEKKTKIQYGF